MAKVLIDIGNTNAKIVLYLEGKYSVICCAGPICVEDIKDIEKRYNIESVALSAVGEVEQSVLIYLRNRYKDSFLEFDSRTPIPIKNLYSTPETLGSDRLLAAVAANNIYKEQNVLVVDIGSAITIDFINSSAEYLGGNISVGVQLRFKSLNKFTKMLPLCSITQNNKLIANSTCEAIELGVINGIIYELEGYISRYKKKYSDLKIIFTGGDAKFFANKINNTIFVDSELVLVGLNIVVDYNVKRD